MEVRSFKYKFWDKFAVSKSESIYVVHYGVLLGWGRSIDPDKIDTFTKNYCQNDLTEFERTFLSIDAA